MGLDTVELLMDIEETFEITIPDESAMDVRTVGDLYYLIMKEVRSTRKETGLSLTEHVFDMLKQQLASLFNNPDLPQAESRIDDYIPKMKRRARWCKLEKSMELRLPTLQRPSWITLALCMIVASLTIGFGVHFLVHPESTYAILKTLSVFLLTSITLRYLTIPFANHLPHGIKTIRELSMQITAINYAKMNDQHKGFNAGDIWSSLQYLIVKQLGVEAEEVTPSAELVRDLGCS